MRTPTLEQQAILDSPVRVRVVCATPGSGKTWLVAKLIRQELDKWPTRTNGVAALSFTRVGGEEIRKTVSHEFDTELGHPHYVGTIDTFLFRYVVRPFLQKCSELATPQLIPGEWGPEHWDHYGQNQKVNLKNDLKLFNCMFTGEENGRAVVVVKPGLRRLDNSEEAIVKNAMLEQWKKSGRLTHSDVALWASKILEDEKFGAIIRKELARRFPLIIVDELQDTSYFLGKSVLLLLQEPTIRGVLVGDPDQAIYEFNGARPDLFNRFEVLSGYQQFYLSISQRCPDSIAAAASHLKVSPGNIGPAPDKSGRSFLVRYNDISTDIPRIVDVAACERDRAKIKVISRKSFSLPILTRQNAQAPLNLDCFPLYHIHRGVFAFRRGRQFEALAAARAALEWVIFGYEGVSNNDLEKRQIEPSKWKRLAVNCLLRANAEVVAGTVYDWQVNVGKILDEELSQFVSGLTTGFSTCHMIPQKNIEGWDKACADYLPIIDRSAVGLNGVAVQTVHSVKGETHEVTVFVCPETRVERCPSVLWWSDGEERRIAYVAMTRTQGDLILCVSTTCYQRLCEKRPEFVKSFKCLTVDEYVLTT